MGLCDVQSTARRPARPGYTDPARTVRIPTDAKDTGIGLIVGYQTYRTGDKSRNDWWVALLTWGDGWHNNHHAFPASARHGLRWFELDTTWLTICLLKVLGLARDVRLPSAAAPARGREKESAAA